MTMNQAISVEFNPPVCYLTFLGGNGEITISSQLIIEFTQALNQCDVRLDISVLVLQGNQQSFCAGADFNEIIHLKPNKDQLQHMAEALYNIWLRLLTSDYITIAHVEGNVKAGGIGFVSACDITIAGENIEYSLPELFFGVFPACVLPFLQRRIGIQRAHYLTLSTRPINSVTAHEWGLIDVIGDHSKSLVRNHLIRLSKLDRHVVGQYKKYNAQLNKLCVDSKSTAITANAEIFSQQRTFDKMYAYINNNSVNLLNSTKNRED